jgi:hypothetical protein
VYYPTICLERNVKWNHKYTTVYLIKGLSTEAWTLMGSGSIAQPLINSELYRGELYPPSTLSARKRHRYPLDIKLGWSQSQSGSCEEDLNLCLEGLTWTLEGSERYSLFWEYKPRPTNWNHVTSMQYVQVLCITYYCCDIANKIISHQLVIGGLEHFYIIKPYFGFAFR